MACLGGYVGATSATGELRYDVVRPPRRPALRGAAWRCRPGLASVSAQRSGAVRQSEKGAKLAQNLGQLQPFIVVFPQEYMGQLASVGST